MKLISKIYTIMLLLFALISSGCTKQPAEQTLVYENFFERDLIDAFHRVDNVSVSFDQSSENYFQFNGSRTLGRFETGGLTFVLAGFPQHQFIRLEFDLFIHDQWEGNGLRGNGEDVFILNVDDLNVHFSSIINTKCLTRDCAAIQSFPNKITDSDNRENAGVTDPKLPGVCHFRDELGGSKLIRFADIYPHSSNDLKLNIAAGIKDAGPDLCMKSWSIDNLRISVINLPEQ